jgi:hypothetical protein
VIIKIFFYKYLLIKESTSNLAAFHENMLLPELYYDSPDKLWSKFLKKGFKKKFYVLLYKELVLLYSCKETHISNNFYAEIIKIIRSIWLAVDVVAGFRRKRLNLKLIYLPEFLRILRILKKIRLEFLSIGENERFLKNKIQIFLKLILFNFKKTNIYKSQIYTYYYFLKKNQ